MFVKKVLILYFLLIGMILLCNLLVGVCNEIVNVMFIWLFNIFSVGIILDVFSVMWCLDRLKLKLFSIIFMVGIMFLRLSSGLFIFIIIMLVIGCLFEFFERLRKVVICYIWLIILFIFRLWLNFCCVVE